MKTCGGSNKSVDKYRSRHCCNNPLCQDFALFSQLDNIHVMAKGRILKSGGRELAEELEEKGYGWLGLEDAD